MIHLIFPVYNERGNLTALIDSIRQIMAGQSYHMVAVNDGSTDGSLELLNTLKADDLVVIGSVVNMNIGAVFSAGIDEVLKTAGDDDAVFILESDQTSELDVLHQMVARIRSGESDVVIASRYQPGGGDRNFPLSRSIFSYCANYFLRKAFPLKNGVKDYTIFMRCYRALVLKRATACFGSFGLIQSQGFIANSELLVKVSLFTEKISEVPFIYDYGRKVGKSKMNVFRTINEYFVFTWHLKELIRNFRMQKGLQHGR